MLINQIAFQSFRQNKEIRTRFQPESGSDFSCEVEHTGFEPVTSTMRM